VGFYLALAIVGFGWHAVSEGSNDLWRTDLGRPAIWLLLGPLLGLLFGLLVVRAMRWLEPRHPWMGELSEEFADIFGRASRGEVIWLAASSAVGEEILFRGAMMDAWGLLPSSLVFALLHLPPRRSLWPWTASAAILGLSLGALTLATGNLGAAVLAHFTINALNLAYITRDEN
jgi:membrane protease YdiL (CAAX protease family)